MPADGNWLLADTARDEAVRGAAAGHRLAAAGPMQSDIGTGHRSEASGGWEKTRSPPCWRPRGGQVARWTSPRLPHAKVWEHWQADRQLQAVGHLCAQGWLCVLRQPDVLPPMRPPRRAADSAPILIVAAVPSYRHRRRHKSHRYDRIQPLGNRNGGALSRVICGLRRATGIGGFCGIRARVGYGADPGRSLGRRPRWPA